jgi:hypothetical protein
VHGNRNLLLLVASTDLSSEEQLGKDDEKGARTHDSAREDTY